MTVQPDLCRTCSKTRLLVLSDSSFTVFQGQEGARITRLAEDGKPVCFIDEDIQTLHEAYKRGARESSKLLGTESLLLGLHNHYHGWGRGCY